MTYQLKINKKIEEILVKTSGVAEENKQSVITVPHLAFVLMNETSISELLEKELSMEKEKQKEILNFFLSEIYAINDLSQKGGKLKKSFILNDVLAELIKVSQELNESVVELFDEVDLFSLLILKLKEYSDMGVQTAYYKAFFEDVSKHQEEYIIHKFKNAIEEIDNRPVEDDWLVFDDIHDELNEELANSVFNEKGQKNKKKDGHSTIKMPSYLINLNKKIINQDNYDGIYIDKVITDRINYVLSKKDKSMPIIIGDSGVGKTSIIYAFCKKLIKKEINPMLENKSIFEVDLIKLFAGCIYRGSLEERITEMFEYLRKEKNIILFVDNLKINKNSNQQEEFMSSFMHYLKLYNVKCILSMDYKEYQKSLKSHPQISSNATTIEVLQPNKEKVKEMVMLNIKEYEKFHNVSFSENVIDKVIDLSEKYITEKNNPLKSFEVIDELGALRSSGIKKSGEIDESDVLKIISEKSKVVITQEKNELEKVINLESEIKKQIFGQDHVIESVASSVMISVAGFNDETKPYLSLMFTGTTGVGKTELVKQLSEKLNRKMIRYDMSEYSEQHTVSKLIGSPSGYIGYDDGGLLTNEIRRNPYSIILFDEIEKGHPKVFDLFLQILDEGFVTDAQGNKISFKNSIIVFTSNAGVSEKAKKSIGFGENKEDNKINFDVLTKYFKPEFLNRIGSVVEFNMLNKEVMDNIALKCLADFERKLNNKNIQMKTTPKVKSWLAENGYDENLGARPMSRLVQKEIIERFSKIYLDRKIKNKSIENCSISVKDKEIIIDVN